MSDITFHFGAFVAVAAILLGALASLAIVGGALIAAAFQQDRRRALQGAARPGLLACGNGILALTAACIPESGAGDRFASALLLVWLPLLLVGGAVTIFRP